MDWMVPNTMVLAYSTIRYWWPLPEGGLGMPNVIRRRRRIAGEWPRGLGDRVGFRRYCFRWPVCFGVWMRRECRVFGVGPSWFR
eukprot:scaffold64328_cov61-Cyclotella_meneghiniana.AAC.2